MAENKNQSWPSVTGRSRGGSGFDINNISPRQRLDNLRKQKFQGEMALTSQYAAIMQNLGARSIANQEQLAMTRQTNLQRMADLYSNYFQEFGGVLNEGALEFLDKHSKINVPTLTAIMAGYEHARASAADRELMALQKQEQLLKEGLAIEQERTALADKRAANDALALTTNLEQAAKSYSDYMNGVIADAGGAGATGRRGAGGAGGVGSGSAAGAFQAPVTGGGGTGTVAGGGATGVFDPNSPEFLAAQKQIADSKAAQMAGQASQLGPLATQARGDIEGITQWSDLDNIWTRGVALGGTYLGGKYLTASGNRVNSTLTKALTDAQKGLADAEAAFKDSKGASQLFLKNEKAARDLRSRALRIEDHVRNLASRDLRFSDPLINKDLNKYVNYLKTQTSSLTPEERGMVRAYDNAQKFMTKARGIEGSLEYAGGRTAYNEARAAISNAKGTVTGAKSAIDASKRSVGKLLARGAGTILSKAALPLTIADTVFNYGDEVFGAGAAGLQWLGDRISDLTGFTTVHRAKNRPTIGQYYNENRDAYLAAQNQFFNTISGGRLNVALEDADVQQVVGRLRELGWGGEGSNWGENNFNIHQLMQMKRNDPDSFYKALDALYQYDPQTQGNISPLEYFNRAASKAAFDRTYATQANKAAQNQQLTNQQAAEEAEKANMIDPRTHRFLAAMMKHYTDMGRQAGYDFHEGHAIQFANVLQQIIADMESGNKQGAVGANTSTGPATSRYQMKKRTFQSAVKWMLDEDEKAGNQLLNSDEREILREVRSKDANFLDNDQYKHLLGMMVLLYPLKSSVSASKFGKGNPDIRGDQMIVDMIQQFKNGGNKLTPYLLSNIGVWHGGAGWGRTGEKEFNNIQNRYTALIQSNFGPDHVATGVYTPDAQIAEWLGSQGIQWNPKYDPTVWRDKWVMENFDKNEKGDDLVPKSTYKPYEQWKIDNGLNQVRQVGKPEQITMSQYIRKLNDGVDFDNLDPLVKRQLNAMAEEVGKYGRTVQLNSGRRDPVKNDELIRRWESGDREGMVHKPSKNSKHLTGVAFDMQRSGTNGLDDIVNNTPELKQKYGDARGMMAAYGFDNNVKNDPVHFSLNEDFRKNNSRSSGWTLPSVASLPFAPVEYPEVVVEEQVPSQIQYPQGLDFLGQYIDPGMMIQQPAYPQTNWGVAMEQLQQYIPENQ